MIESWLSPGSYRVRQLEKIAKKTDFSFTTKDEFGVINLLKDFRLFQIGGSKRIVNILRDKTNLQEADFRVFDYQYTISDGDNALNFPQTVFFGKSKNLALPSFSLKSPQFFHKMGNYMDFEDIDEEEPPLFSQQDWLEGGKNWTIRESMSEELVRFFTTEPDWNVEGLNYFMIFYKRNKVLKTTEILDFFEKGKQIMDMFARPQKK